LKTKNDSLNPQVDILTKMIKLPELKERVQNYKNILNDLKEILDEKSI